MDAVKLIRSLLSLPRQCELQCIPRSSYCYAPVPEKPENLKMMSLMETHLTSYLTGGVLSIEVLKNCACKSGVVHRSA